MKIVIVFILTLIFLLVIVLLPLPIPAYLDFQVIYHANMGLLRGISVYDHAGQVNMIAGLAHVRPAQVYVLPFPYPPWYALSTLWLALLSIGMAARAWFGLNLLMLFASVLLLTEDWEPLERLAACCAGIFFIPMLGTLVVGQYVLPILLGASLWIYALRHENAWLTALAAILLTFKPHLGGILILFGLLYLFNRRDDYGRRALSRVGLSGVLLFGIGFLADPVWPLNYLHSLLAFGQDAGVASCGLCASLPVALVDLITGGGNLSLALLIGLLIFLALLAWWGFTRRMILQNPIWLTVAAILIVLLSSPYLLNYDFLLLLVPIFLLAGESKKAFEWVLVVVSYLVPLVAFVVLGRQGNALYSVSTLILLVLVFYHTRRLDVSPDAAYNPAITQ